MLVLAHTKPLCCAWEEPILCVWLAHVVHQVWTVGLDMHDSRLLSPKFVDMWYYNMFVLRTTCIAAFHSLSYCSIIWPVYI